MSDSTDQTPDEIMQALAAPFEASEVKFKPGVISGNRALALHYVDARVVQDRLDDVLGVAGWQDDYQFLEGGEVVCRLKVRIGGEWLTKVDVGGESEQPDGGDRKKAAVSDALKRAAVKFGIGRYLYRLPSQWVDYDPQKKQIKGTPQLPACATPVPAKKAAPKAEPDPAKTPAKKPDLPANGVELHKRLTDYDGRLARQGLCQPGDLLRAVAMDGVSKKHYPPSITEWNSEEQILFAVETVKATEARWRTPPPKPAGPPPTPAGKISPEQVRKLQALADDCNVFWPDVAAKVGKDKAGRPKDRIEDLTPAEWLVAMDLLSSRLPEAAAAE